MPLTTQQRLILEQTQRLYDTTDRTGEHLDGKAGTILQAGSLIIALTGATVLPSIVAAGTSPGSLAGVALGFVAFIGMTLCALAAWQPGTHHLAGSADWDRLYDLYISVECDDAYNQVLVNLSDAIDANQAMNERKARFVTVGTWLLAVQVAGILLLALLGAQA
jgi:hypothetical protein